MANSFIERSEKVNDYLMKTRRLVVPFNITGNATPASKVVKSDMNGTVYIRTEGLTAAADAVEASATTNFGSPSDSTGVFGILVDVGAAQGALVRKILDCQVLQRTGSSATNQFQVVAFKGASTTGVSVNGRVAVDVTCAGLDLSSENFDGALLLEYVIEL